MTPAPYNVTIFVKGRLVRSINNVRSNGNFRALRRYLTPRYPVATINLYYQGVFQRQIRWDASTQYF